MRFRIESIQEAILIYIGLSIAFVVTYKLPSFINKLLMKFSAYLFHSNISELTEVKDDLKECRLKIRELERTLNRLLNTNNETFPINDPFNLTTAQGPPPPPVNNIFNGHVASITSTAEIRAKTSVSRE